MYEQDALTLEQKRNPMTARILDRRILRPLEKPPQLQIYEVIGYPNEHAKHMDDRLYHYHALGAVKSELFAFTLKESLMN